MPAPSSRSPAHSDPEVLTRLLAERYTCRAYRPEAVPDDVIRRIVDIARRTPSWCNVQPWHVVITSQASTPAFRGALVAQAAQAGGVDSDLPFPKEYVDIYAERRREAGFKLYAALGIQRGDKERYAQQSFENYRLFGAPHVAILTTRADLGPYGAVDCGGFVSTFLLAAHAHGVATSPQAALARHAKFIRSYFGLGEDRHLICGISFGYADAEHPVNRFRTSRAALDDVMKIV